MHIDAVTKNLDARCFLLASSQVCFPFCCEHTKSWHSQRLWCESITLLTHARTHACMQSSFFSTSTKSVSPSQQAASEMERGDAAVRQKGVQRKPAGAKWRLMNSQGFGTFCSQNRKLPMSPPPLHLCLWPGCCQMMDEANESPRVFKHRGIQNFLSLISSLRGPSIIYSRLCSSFNHRERLQPAQNEWTSTTQQNKQTCGLNQQLRVGAITRGRD